MLGMDSRLLTGRLAIAVTFAGGIAGAIVLFCFDPSLNDWYPRCQFHELTGLYCPGCGSTRAVYWLLHGDILRALRFNPLTVVALPWLAYRATRSALARVRTVPPPLPGGGRRIGSGMIFWVVLSFGVLRNVPVYPFTCLAPPERDKPLSPAAQSRDDLVPGEGRLLAALEVLEDHLAGL